MDALAYFDGNWFDVLSIAGGVVYALLNRLRLEGSRPFLSAATGRDLLNGLSIVPLLFLAFGVVSTPALTAVLHFNRLILAAAALSALFAILEET